MRLIDPKEHRLLTLTELAWIALIQAEPNGNPAMLAVKARKLAEAFLKVEEASDG